MCTIKNITALKIRQTVSISFVNDLILFKHPGCFLFLPCCYQLTITLAVWQLLLPYDIYGCIQKFISKWWIHSYFMLCCVSNKMKEFDKRKIPVTFNIFLRRSYNPVRPNLHLHTRMWHVIQKFVLHFFFFSFQVFLSFFFNFSTFFIRNKSDFLPCHTMKI